MAQPYIPTDEERGAAYRADLGLASIEQARTVDHPFRGSHIRGLCFVCWQPQPSPRHGPIHFVEAGSFACDPGGRAGVRAPMTQRTIRRQYASCPGCVAVLSAAEVLGFAPPAAARREASSAFCPCHNDPRALCPRWEQWGVTAAEHTAAEAEAARVPNAVAAGVCPDCDTPLGAITASGTRGCSSCGSWFAVPGSGDCRTPAVPSSGPERVDPRQGQQMSENRSPENGPQEGDEG